MNISKSYKASQQLGNNSSSSNVKGDISGSSDVGYDDVA